MGWGAGRKAGWGEWAQETPRIPSEPNGLRPPPLSLTKMPMSWLKPPLAVQRSALPPTNELVSAPGATVTSRAASMGCQLTPSEFDSEYWLADTALYGFTPAPIV